MATRSTSSERKVRRLIDDDLVAHPELLVKEVAAVRVVEAGARDQRNALGFIRPKFDFALGCRTRSDAGIAEEAVRGEVVAAVTRESDVERKRV